MNNISYRTTVNRAAEMAPSLDKPGEVIRWAEDICELIAYIYEKDYDTVTTDVYEAVKEEQDYED
jgi:hypothetical protein